MVSLRGFQFALLSFTGTVVLGQDLNVYDKTMGDCGASHAGGCTYFSGDAGAHQVCVTQLPKGFSSDTGQGPWSDEFTGEPWCICIWAYSNYILQKKDLRLKCESIPAKVLEEKYSLDKFKQCGSMSSTDGCGPEDIRRSIQSLCQQCDDQASDAASKAALKQKCDKILAVAPQAHMLWDADASSQDMDSLPEQAPGKTSMPSYALGLIIAGGTVGMALFVFRRRRGNTSSQQQHDDSSANEEIE
jgi:hypothetical protein